MIQITHSLVPNKCSDLVGLKFTDDKAFQHPIAEPGCICGRRFKPSSDRAPGHSLDPGHGRYRKPVDTHVDHFIEQRPGFMQPIIRCAVSGREGSAAFFATVASPSSLRCDVEGVSDNIAFSDLASQGAIGVWTAARSSSAPLHICLMSEKPEKIQLAQEIAGLLDTLNNTSLKKHPNLCQKTG